MRCACGTRVAYGTHFRPRYVGLGIECLCLAPRARCRVQELRGAIREAKSLAASLCEPLSIEEKQALAASIQVRVRVC